jgi:nicotinamidase-related amidase
MRIPRDTVLLLVDLQQAIDDPGWGPRNNPQAEANIAALLALWRRVGFPVIHVRHDSSEPRSPYRPGQPGHAFRPEAQPVEGERVVPKQTNSAFVGTELEAMLTETGCTTLVACGVLTANSLEATVRHAGNLGYRVFVPQDACWAVDKRDLTGRVWAAQDVHDLSLAHLDGEYARVVDTATTLAAAELTASRLKR